MQKIVALFLCLLTLLSVVGCTPQEEPVVVVPEYMPENAIELWEKVNDKMDALDSIRMNISTQKTYYEKGYKYNQSTSRYVVSTRDIHYAQTTSTLGCNELVLHESMQITEAYYEGRMYRSLKKGAYKQNFCSEMTHEEYDALQSSGATDDLSLSDCTNAKFSKTDDGLWQLEFSGYTKKTVDQAMNNLSITEQEMGAPITDMQVRILANEDFLATYMEIYFVFAPEGEVSPIFSVKTEYSSWNAVTFDSAPVDPEAYTPVEDVYLLDVISAALAQRQNASIGQFTLETKTTQEYQGKTVSSEEKGVMIYGWKNGAYNYFFTANTEGQSFLVSYQNGVQTVISNGQSYTAASSDAEAKAYIDGLIDSANYTPIAITEIERQQDGSYVLFSDCPDIAGYVGGIEVTSANQQIVVTFTDGKLTQISSRLIIEGIYAEEPIKIQTESSVMYTENAAFPE